MNDRLASLVQHGLVTRVGTPTPALPRIQRRESEPVPTAEKKVEDVPAYRLHDLAYSYTRAQNGEEQRGRALEACLAYVARYNELTLPNFAALRPELDNLLNAAGWAFEMGQYEAVEKFARDLVTGLYRSGEILTRQVPVIKLLQQAANVAESVGNKVAQSIYLTNLGSAYVLLGQLEKGIGYFRRALQISRDIGARQIEGGVLVSLGIAYFSEFHVMEVIEYHEQALAICREIGDRKIALNVFPYLLEAYNDLGRMEKVIEHSGQYLSVSAEIGDLNDKGNALRMLGIAHMKLGQLDTALDYYQQARAIYVEIGAQHMVEQVDENIARVRGSWGVGSAGDVPHGKP